VHSGVIAAESAVEQGAEPDEARGTSWIPRLAGIIRNALRTLGLAFGGRRVADEQYETTILYLIRDHGHLRIETDYWTMGLFSLDTWRRVLRETGFEVHEGRYNAGEDEYTVFACVKTR